MTEQAEPAYRTAYKTSKSSICPECGEDFTGQTGAQVLAHIEGVHPGFNASLDSDAAKERFGILRQIAKELG